MGNAVRVTAVMVTGKDADRLPFATAAVKLFEASRKVPWATHRLLVVTDYDKPEELQFADHELLAVPKTPGRFLGGLRNLALDWIHDRSESGVTELVLQWDDDDYHQADRMASQLELARQHEFSRPVTLLSQLRFDTLSRSGLVYIGEHDYGVFGTVLHSLTSHRYENVPKHEDSRYLKTILQGKSAITLADKPSLYTRLYHGGNTWNRAHIMPKVQNYRCVWLSPTDNQKIADELFQVYPFLANKHDTDSTES